MAPTEHNDDAAPVYLAGLHLNLRRVLVVGGGAVAARRVPALVAAGAQVVVVSPEISPALEALAAAGQILWLNRPYTSDDVADAWYVVAATNVPAVNAQVTADAEAHHTFCVRADDGRSGTAITPATGTQGGYTVAVASAVHRRKSEGERGYAPATIAAIRDGIIAALGRGEWSATATSWDDDLGDTWGPAEPAAGWGRVALVGGGPGHPDLITVRGRRLLALADVVVADHLGPRELLSELAPRAEIVDASKLPRGRFMHQDTINNTLISHAQAGKRVVRLKGGDPFIFGRGWEEIEACIDAGVTVSVVPGVSSATSVPALAGIPLTHRGLAQEAVIVSGHVPPEDPASQVNWDAIAQLRGTVVVLMGLKNLPAIASALVAGGRSLSTPVSVLVEGSMAAERRVHGTLMDISEKVMDAQLQPPGIIVIGDVAALSA